MALPYLDMVVSETLRKYPPLPFLDRVAVSDYKVPGTDLVIEKGTPLYIPMFGLHYDPEYFPESQKYDPERFNEENKNKIPSCVYMPFGEGPHNCIGKERSVFITARFNDAYTYNSFCQVVISPYYFLFKAFVLDFCKQNWD